MQEKEKNQLFYNVSHIIREQKALLYSVIVAVIVTYGYEISNWTLTIDEEIWSYSTKNNFARGWIGDGRWGIALLKTILPTHKVIPFFNSLCAVIVLGISAFLIGYIFQKYISSKAASIIAALVFVTIPIHSYYLMFDTFAVEVSIGLVLAILSGYYCVDGCMEKRKKRVFVSIGSLLLSLSIYQSFFQIFASVVCSILLLNIVKEIKTGNEDKTGKEYFMIILQSIGVLIMAALGYVIINCILQSYFGRSSYVDGYFRWSYVDYKTCIEQAQTYLKWLFLNPSTLFQGGSILKMCYIIYSIELILLLIKKKGKRLIIILLFIGLNLSICIEYVIFAGAIPLRTMQSIAVYCSLTFFLLYAVCHKVMIKRIIVVGACLVALYQSSTVVEMFYSENIRQEQDNALLNRVISEIEDLQLGEEPPFPIVITGFHNWNGKYSVKTEQFSLSMFDTKQAFRAYKWMSVKGYNYINPTEEQQTRAEEIAKDMPVWPYEGSVAVHEEMIIVNFGVEE